MQADSGRSPGGANAVRSADYCHDEIFMDSFSDRIAKLSIILLKEAVVNEIAHRPIETSVRGFMQAPLLVVAGVVLMTLAAKAEIPFWPVPMTLHTLAVMAFALALGPRIAVAIFLAYLAAGAAGLPVFSGSPQRGVGLAYMAGPTGGYLLGYLIASGLIGTLARGRGLVGRIAAMLAGLLVVYGVGAAWLSCYVPPTHVLALGVLPFLAGDSLKVGVVAVLGVVLPASGAWLREGQR
jgi:biotin transport system substrate-specific component